MNSDPVARELKASMELMMAADMKAQAVRDVPSLHAGVAMVAAFNSLWMAGMTACALWRAGRALLRSRDGRRTHTQGKKESHVHSAKHQVGC